MSSVARAPVKVASLFRIRTLQVVQVEQVARGMRRIALNGPDLEPTFPTRRLAPGEHVKVTFPDEDTGQLRLPAVVDGRLRMPEGPRPVLRDYTVRALEPGDGDRGPRLILDFVLHPHGPAGRWAQGARAGQRIGVGGPRGSLVYPASYRRYVLIADDTALPALARWIEEAPADAELVAHAIVSPAADGYPLPSHPGLDLTWVSTPDPTEATPGLAATLIGPDPDTFVWAAGEATSLKPVRDRLREIGALPGRADIDGYWRRGAAGLGHHGDRA